MDDAKTYKTQSARDAQARNYGGPSYWDYLDRAECANRDYWLSRGDTARANEAMTRTLSEALRGNDGE